MRVVELPDDDNVRLMIARWCLEEWAHLFPEDTEQWYLDMYADAYSSGSNPPHALVAVEGDTVVGTASLVPDDDLPGAREPGPWLAAVYVTPSHRDRGVGRALVTAILDRAESDVWLYTENEMSWYESMGWTRVRDSEVNGHPVTVMVNRAV